MNTSRERFDWLPRNNPLPMNFIAVPLLIAGISLITYLLMNKWITPAVFTALFAVISFSSIVMLALDRLVEVDFKSLKATLSDIRDVQKDVYAKADTVRAVAEQLSRLSIATAAANDDTRRQLITLLQTAGSNKSTIDNVKSDISKRRIDDAKDKFYRSAEFVVIFCTNQPGNDDQNLKRLHELVYAKYDRCTLEKILAPICDADGRVDFLGDGNPIDFKKKLDAIDEVIQQGIE